MPKSGRTWPTRYKQNLEDWYVEMVEPDQWAESQQANTPIQLRRETAATTATAPQFLQLNEGYTFVVFVLPDFLVQLPGGAPPRPSEKRERQSCRASGRMYRSGRAV